MSGKKGLCACEFMGLEFLPDMEVKCSALTIWKCWFWAAQDMKWDFKVKRHFGSKRCVWLLCRVRGTETSGWRCNAKSIGWNTFTFHAHACPRPGIGGTRDAAHAILYTGHMTPSMTSLPIGHGCGNAYHFTLTTTSSRSILTLQLKHSSILISLHKHRIRPLLERLRVNTRPDGTSVTCPVRESWACVSRLIVPRSNRHSAPRIF